MWTVGVQLRSNTRRTHACVAMSVVSVDHGYGYWCVNREQYSCLSGCLYYLSDSVILLSEIWILALAFIFDCAVLYYTSHHHHHHQSLNREGRWGTTDDFATSFLHISLFSTALWDLVNSRPVHSLMLSSHLFLCLPCLLLPFTVPCKMVFARPDEHEK